MNENLLVLTAVISAVIAGVIFGKIKKFPKKGSKVLAICTAVLLEVYAVVIFTGLTWMDLNPIYVGTATGYIMLFLAGFSMVGGSITIALIILIIEPEKYIDYGDEENDDYDEEDDDYDDYDEEENDDTYDGNENGKIIKFPYGKRR